MSLFSPYTAPKSLFDMNEDALVSCNPYRIVLNGPQKDVKGIPSTFSMT